MELIVVPAVVAIILKIALFWRYSESLKNANYSLGLFFFAACVLNLVELFGYQPNFGNPTQFTILLAYCCAAVLVVHGYLNLAIEYSGFSWNVSKVKLVLNVLLALLILNVIFNRQVIAGAEFTGVALTRVAGAQYWVFQVYLLAGIFSGSTLLWRGFRRLQSNIAKQRCFVLSLAALPPALVSVSVIAMMAAGSTITSAIMMPIAISIMLGVIVFAEEKTRLFRLLSFVPYTRERKLHSDLIAKVTDCLLISEDPANQESLNLKLMMKDFEGSVVEHVINYYDGNQKLAAKALGVSEATISRRARALNQVGATVAATAVATGKSALS